MASHYACESPRAHWDVKRCSYPQGCRGMVHHAAAALRLLEAPEVEAALAAAAVTAGLPLEAVRERYTQGLELANCKPVCPCTCHLCDERCQTVARQHAEDSESRVYAIPMNVEAMVGQVLALATTPRTPPLRCERCTAFQAVGTMASRCAEAGHHEQALDAFLGVWSERR